MQIMLGHAEYTSELLCYARAETDNWHTVMSFGIYIYIILDGYSASLGFPIMHRVHAICTQS